MTEKEAIQKILNTPKLDLPPTLDRIKSLLAAVGNPQLRLRAIHVAGTNGKGSTSTMIASSLSAAGLKVGLFTSPYINDFKERFIIDEAPVSASVFTPIANAVFEAAKGYEYTQFELITAIGLCIFAEANCDIVVLECGLGGRFDATNAIPAPIVSVICQIGYDHTAILGETIEAIAAEKSKIIKSGTSSVIISPQHYPEAYGVLESEAFRAGVRCIRVKKELAEIISRSPKELRFRYREDVFTSSLTASYQINNAITAIEALRALSDSGTVNITNEHIKIGLSSSYIPARLEIIRKRPTVILDGAHNIDGMRALRESLERMGRYHVMVGMLKDKYPARALCELFANNNDIISVTAVTPSSPRAMSARELAKIIKDITDAPVFEADSIRGGAIDVLSRAASEDTIVCCGSLYIMGELRRAYSGEDI